MLSIGSLERLGFSGAPVQRQSSGGNLSARGLQKDGAVGPDGTLAMHEAFACHTITDIMGGDLETKRNVQEGRICRTEIAMVAVDARGVEHTLRSWILFDRKEGLEGQLGSGGEAIDHDDQR